MRGRGWRPESRRGWPVERDAVLYAMGARNWRSGDGRCDKTRSRGVSGGAERADWTSGAPSRVCSGRMCEGECRLRGLRTRTGERDIRSIVRPVEAPLDDELFDEGQARRAVKLPETTRLWEHQTEAWHFLVLTANASQEAIVGWHDWIARVIPPSSPRPARKHQGNGPREISRCGKKHPFC
jgi:hypothetical protein